MLYKKTDLGKNSLMSTLHARNFGVGTLESRTSGSGLAFCSAILIRVAVSAIEFDRMRDVLSQFVVKRKDLTGYIFLKIHRLVEGPRRVYLEASMEV